MNVFKQVFAEAKNMLRSKFIFISMILAFAFITVGTPILGIVMDKLRGDDYFYGRYDNEELVVNGVTIDPENDFYWEIRNLSEQKDYMEDWFNNEGAYDYALELTDIMLDFYLDYSPLLAPRDEDYNSDYRMDFMYEMRENITSIYVLNVMDPQPAALQEAIDQVSWGGTDVTKLLEMENEEATELLAAKQKDMDDFDKLMKDNDFSFYVDMRMRRYEETIASNLERIKTLEADIVANPDQADYAAEEIKRLEISNKNITEGSIPELEYRLENNIVPGDGSWQDKAISTVSSSKSSIESATLYKMTETEFNDDQWAKERYGNYKNYLETIESDRKRAEKNLFIAQSSLDSGKPDMDFVPNGARQKLYDTFPLSVLVVVFGALIGGWCIASEFQSGTVRLMMIRPRTRMTILFTRYGAGLILVYALYFASFFVNFIINGAVNGFADYMLPNYTASSTILFGFAWLTDLLFVSLGFVFIYSFSFAMSSMVKNMAVSIILPTLALLGSTIALAYLSSQPPVTLIAYTPLPYLIMSDFFGSDWNSINNMIDMGVPLSLPLGAAVLAAYSALLMAIAAIVFKKKDITN